MKTWLLQFQKSIRSSTSFLIRLIKKSRVSCIQKIVEGMVGCLSIMAYSTLQAQNPSLPNVILPSPEAQKMQLFGNYPVSSATGIPDISVPLYEIKSGKLSLPISIKYHASGLKPNEESGLVALGWSLNAGGMVNRTVVGLPDEQHWSDLVRSESSIRSFPNHMDSDPDYDYLDKIDNKHTDTQFDIFNYQLLNGGGKFIFNKNSDLNQFLQPYLLPKKPVLVIPNFSQSTFNYFDIMDEQGNQYRFGKSVKTGTIYTERFVSFSAPPPIGNLSSTTSWLLTEIISADKSDTISFIYDDVSNGAYINQLHRSFGIEFQNCDNGIPINVTTTVTGYAFTTKVLKEIQFKTGKVAFTYKSLLYPDNQLSEIQIYSKQSTIPLRKIKMTQSLYSTSTEKLKRYKLDEVAFWDSQSHQVEKYSFKYRDDLDFPKMDDNLTKESYSIDYWGFYNGYPNSELIPPIDVVIDYTQILRAGKANRDANAAYMQTGILKEIWYPTGGYTQFEYEGNESMGTTTGGLRVSKITNRTDQNMQVKTFKYVNGISVLNNHTSFNRLFIKGAVRSTGDSQCSINGNIEVVSVSGDPRLNVMSLAGAPVMYDKVIEYLGDDLDNTGKIEHFFNVNTPYNNNPVDYLFERDINSYWGSPLNMVNGQYFEGYYQAVTTYGDTPEKTTEYFAFDKEKDSYSLVKKVENEYQNELVSTLNGLMVERQYSYGGGVRLYNKVYHFAYVDYFFQQIWQKLLKSTTYTYVDNGTVISSIDYEYANSHHQQITKQSTTTSKGETLETHLWYPTDYSNVESMPALLTNNIIATPIKTEVYRNQKITSGTVNRLDAFGKPYEVYQYEVSSPQAPTAHNPSVIIPPGYVKKADILYDGDTRNIQWMQANNRAPVAYLWGYQQSYPIAQINNSETIREQDKTRIEEVPVTGDRTIQSIVESFQSFGTWINLNINQTLRFKVVLSDPIGNGWPVGAKLELGIMNSAGEVIKAEDPYYDHYGTYSEEAGMNIGNLPLDTYRLVVKTTDYPSPSSQRIQIRIEGSYNQLMTIIPSQYYFHTSFEDEQHSGTDDAQAHTGRRSHLGSFQLPVRIPSGQYILSYWKKTSQTASWVYQQQSLTGTNTQPTITVESNEWIDEVRLYPQGAQMTTYTYDPLVGVTSSTDISNVTTYYEYDEYQRLKWVKDQDGNIIKHYVYHYKGQ